jgi:hypothetical protein
LVSAVVNHKYPNASSEDSPMAYSEKVEKKICNLQQREQLRRSFHRISITLKPSLATHTAFARIDVPSGDTRPFPDGPDPKQRTGPWVSITEPP